MMLIGRKIGMTQLFEQSGKVVPVSVIEAGPSPVVQVKTPDKEGYAAIQIGFDEVKESRVNKAETGHFKKANVTPRRILREVRVEGHADPKTQLFSYLREKQALLLTDNREHLLAEPGIVLLAELLANASQVKLLATSRESLELQDEWVFEVQGLPVPESGYAEESAQNTSVELFLQRARRAHVGFSATSEDYPAIVRICQLVDGMPLGIELAAAWVRTLSCDEIVKEIERGMDFLSVTTRDMPTRHRSMRAVFDHSWKLLSEKEQAVLLPLSVFRGGFQRKAAEEVVGAELSTLSMLVAKSLVQRSGDHRYDLHELIRQFAAEQLLNHPEEHIATHARHGSCYLTYFARADARLRSSAQRETLAELTTEMDNFRTAWAWAITNREFVLIEQSIRTLAYFYDIRGWLQEGIDTFDNAVTKLETSSRERINQYAHLHGEHVNVNAVI